MKTLKKQFLSFCMMLLAICSYAEELQPQQITSCNNQYYLDYYAQLAEVVNRAHYVIGSDFTRVWCPGYYHGGNLNSNYNNRPSPIQKGKNNGVCAVRMKCYADNSTSYTYVFSCWQDRSGGKPGIYDKDFDKIIYEKETGLLVDGLQAHSGVHIYYYDKNNNDLFDDDEFAWQDSTFYDYSMQYLLYLLRSAIYELYTEDKMYYAGVNQIFYIKYVKTVHEDLTNTTTPSTDIPHLIEYDEAGNVISDSVKLFPERSGESAYMFTKIPTHLADGTQIAASPEYAKNWGANEQIPVLKIHLDEIREVLNRNHFKSTLYYYLATGNEANGKWETRGENNSKRGVGREPTFLGAYNTALNEYNSLSYSDEFPPSAWGYHSYYAYPSDEYNVSLHRTYSYLTGPSNMAPFSRTVDFYIMGAPYYNYPFNSQGDSILDGKWSRFAQHIDSEEEEEYAKFGSFDVPSLGNEREQTGYITKDSAIIFKWNLPTIDIPEFTPLYADVPDTNRDGRYDIGVDFDEPEFATGNFVHLPDMDSPQLFIPVCRDLPVGEDGKTPWVYIGQGEKKSSFFSYIRNDWSYDYIPANIISPLNYANQNNTYLYVNCNTLLLKNSFVDIWYNDSANNIHVKRIGIVRPSRQVVIFDFPWNAESGKFSEIGYPTGIHKKRTYRLYMKEYIKDAYPSYSIEADIAKLQFDNSVIHLFDNFRRSDLPSEFYYYYIYDYKPLISTIVGYKKYYRSMIFDKELVDCGVYSNNEISTMRYSLSYEWDDNYRLSKIHYTSIDDKEKITVELGYDSEGKVVKLTKTVPASMAVNGQTTYEISVNGNTITYPGGITSTRSEKTLGGIREVTITETDPVSGVVVKKYKYDTNEQLLEYTLTANDDSAVTKYEYYADADYSQYIPEYIKDGKFTNNGSRVDQKLKSVTYPDGNWKYYEYNSDGYIEKIYTPFSSGNNSVPGNESGTYKKYVYEKHDYFSYSINPEKSGYYYSWCLSSRIMYWYSDDYLNPALEWIFEHFLLHKEPSTISDFYNGIEISRKYYSNIPDQYMMEEICSNKNTSWNDSSNLSFKKERMAGENIMPRTWNDIMEYKFFMSKESSPFYETSYSYSKDGPVWLFFKYYNYDQVFKANLLTTATVKDASGNKYQTVNTLTNPWGIIESKEVTDTVSGKVIYSENSKTDSFGRIIKTTYLDGTTEEFEDYCLWGPQKVVKSKNNIIFSTTEYKYTAAGLIKQIKPPGKTIDLSYDALGNVTQRKVTVNGKSVIETYTYDAQSRIKSHIDISGVETNYNYTGADVAMTSSDGKTMNIDYNTDGTVASVTGNSVSPEFYEYGADDHGKWKKTIHGENTQAGVWEKEYFNMLGKLCRVEKSSGYYKDYTYDSKGRLSSTKDSNGNQMSLTYNSKSEIASRTVNGATTSYTYGYGTQANKTTYKVNRTTYTSFGNITSQQETSLDGLDSWSTVNGRTNHTSTTPFTGGKATVTTTDFENNISTVSNSSKVNEFTMTTPSMNVKMSLDGLGRTVSTEARSQTTKYEYRGGSSQLAKVTAPDGKRTKIAYTAGQSEPSLISLPGGDTLSPVFNKMGLLESMGGTAPENFDVNKTYDSLGRETNLQTNGAPGPVNTVRNYNSASGALESKTIAGNNVYSITLHNDGRVNTVTCAVGSGSTVTKELQYTAAPKYLFAGVDYSDSTPDVTIAGHDSVFGLPGSVSAAGIISYAFNYNNDLQITSANVTSTASGNKNVGYTYSNLRRQTMTMGSDSVSYEYDTSKRLKKVTSGDVSAEYEYVSGSANTISKVTIKKGAQTVLVRTIELENNSDRIASVTNSRGSTVLNSFTYGYDDKGEINKIIREDGSYCTYTYDKRGQLASAKRYAGGKLRLGESYNYEYDSITNVLKGGRTDLDGNFEFSAAPTAFNSIQTKLIGDKIMIHGEAIENASIAVYVDNNGTPASASKASRKGNEFFATVDAGNSTGANSMTLHIAASYFDPNATPGVGGDQSGNATGADIIREVTGTLVVPKQNETPGYDDGGRLVYNSLYTYIWDAESRLTSVESSVKLDGTNRYKTEYAYDHAGRRIRKQVYTNNDSGWVLSRTHRFFYDTVTLGGASSDFGLLAEEEITDEATSNTRTYQYIWGADVNGSYHGLGGVGGLVAVVDKTDNNIYIPLMDAKGTVYKYIYADNGIVAAEFDYDPYGRIMQRSGSQLANLSLRYQSKYHDTETNTYYYGVRHYDPTTCRWLSRDPLEEEGGYNLYAFVNNDPINNVDYLGMRADILLNWRDQSKDTFLVGHVNNVFYGGLWMLLNPDHMLSSLKDDYKNGKTLKKLEGSLLANQNTITFGLDRYWFKLIGTEGYVNSDSTRKQAYEGAQTGINAFFMANLFRFGTKAIANKKFLGSWTGQNQYGPVKLTTTGTADKVVSLNKNPSPGVTVHKVGNYYVKEVDPNANFIFRWFGKRSLKYQYQGLQKLGDMAPANLLKNGKLITRDAGKYSPGNFWKVWWRATKRLGTPMNDVRPRNIGADGIIFDPALDPIQRAIYWTGIGTIGGTAGYGIYDFYNSNEGE